MVLIKFIKKSPMKINNTDLSVIILNYNSKDYLAKCLASIYQSDLKNYRVEIIVADNASSDNSIDLAKKVSPILNTKYLILNTNLGFAAGNNQGIKISDPKSKYILFLNPDTTVEKDTFQKMIEFFEKNHKVDAATCYVKLALTGQLQPECHRGFPTPLNSFWHFFGFGLPKIFPKSKLFNGYFLGHLDFSKVQQIDCCVGAFFMIKRKVGEIVKWWNEKYFFYGEDLDFCYQLKKNHFKLFFCPNTQITHYQGVSSGIISHTNKISAASKETKIRSAMASVNAMRIFYENNLINDYPAFLRGIIMLGIKLLETTRYFKAKYL